MPSSAGARCFRALCAGGADAVGGAGGWTGAAVGAGCGVGGGEGVGVQNGAQGGGPLASDSEGISRSKLVPRMSAARLDLLMCRSLQCRASSGSVQRHLTQCDRCDWLYG
jgi:hypothetical protein